MERTTIELAVLANAEGRGVDAPPERTVRHVGPVALPGHLPAGFHVGFGHPATAPRFASSHNADCPTASSSVVVLSPEALPAIASRRLSSSPLDVRHALAELADGRSASRCGIATEATKPTARCGPLEADEKNDMMHELDAVVAHLYGLTEAQLVHVFETFHEGWDFRERLDAVLGHFRSWGKRR